VKPENPRIRNPGDDLNLFRKIEVWSSAMRLVSPDMPAGRESSNSTAQPTEQQKAKGRRITSVVLLPLTAGDGS